MATRLVCAAALAAGCSSGAAKPVGAPATTAVASAGTTSTTVAAATVNYGKQLATDFAPVNADFVRLASVHQDSLTAAQVAPMRQDLVTCGRELLSQSWPPNAQADVHTLAVDVETVASDLDGGLDMTNIETFIQDAKRAQAADQVVRADLGLPALPTSG